MPTVTRGDAAVYYEVHGAGPLVLFVPTGGFGPWQWAWQYPAVCGPFRTALYHPRGTGQSSGQPPAATVAPLVADLTAVVEDLDATRLHLVGFGVGGRVALEYAHRHRHVKSLTLIQTPAGDGRPNAGSNVGELASTGDVHAATTRALSDAFVSAQPEVVDQITEWRQAEDAPPAYWQATATVLQAARDWPLYTVTTPTLVVHGGADPVVPTVNARSLAEGLPRARELFFGDAAHLIGIERSRPVNDSLRGFLEEQSEPT